MLHVKTSRVDVRRRCRSFAEIVASRGVIRQVSPSSDVCGDDSVCRTES